jgi:hypothetical protein
MSRSLRGGRLDRGKNRTLTGRSSVENDDWSIRNTAEEVLSYSIWRVEYIAKPQ